MEMTFINITEKELELLKMSEVFKEGNLIKTGEERYEYTTNEVFIALLTLYTLSKTMKFNYTLDNPI